MSHLAADSDNSPSKSHLQECRQAVRPSSDKLTHRQYVVLWTLMIVLHSICAAFLLACAKLYWIMENDLLNYFVSLLAREEDRHFRVVGTSLGALGAIHAFQVLSHLGASIIARRPAIQVWNFGRYSSFIFTQLCNKLSPLKRCWLSPLRNRLHFELVTRFLWTTSDNETYGRVFALRKFVEIATQIPQTYLYSTLIARPWINHAKVATVVTNCWSSCIIHRMLVKNGYVEVAPSSTPQRSDRGIRFLAVVVDALISTASSVVLPSAIFYPYMVQFDFKNLNFPSSLLYGDTAFPNLVLENRAFFAISWANAVIKGVPHVGALLCLITIASMLEPTQSEYIAVSTAPLAKIIPPARKTARVAFASTSALEIVSSGAQKSVRLLRRVQRVTASSLFLTAGLAVLVIHIKAQLDTRVDNVNAMESSCLQWMHPWLGTNSSCSVVKYNCYNHGLVSPPPDALDWMERAAVDKIIFMHCSAFVMPSTIREFPSLMGIELWNVTLVKWGADAALSAELHTELLFVYFTHVNMTGVPDGILQSPFPCRLSDIEFIHTNLTTFSDEIASVWDKVEIVYIEHSSVNTFPSVFMQLPVLSELSLIDNDIETMPDDALLTVSSNYFYDLSLSRNPLKALPRAARHDLIVSYLALEFTQLTELPAWVDTCSLEGLSLAESPVCEARSITKLPEIARCGDVDGGWDELGDERFPIQLVQPYRLLDES